MSGNLIPAGDEFSADSLSDLGSGAVALTNGSAVTVFTQATDIGSVQWRVLLGHTDGRRVSLTFVANLDAAGTGADYSESGVDDNGDWTGTSLVDVSSSTFRLRITAPSTNWTAYAIRTDYLTGA